MKMSLLPFTPKNDPERSPQTFRTSAALIGALMLLTTMANATDLVWIGGTGNWNAAGNWNPAQIPVAGDNAYITNNGTYTVTVPAGSAATAGSVTVGGASGTQTLAIDRATVTLSGASVINANGHLDFLVAQSVLTGAGNLTVNGTLNWANGTMSGAGTTTIGSGGVVAIGSGGVTFGRNLNNSGSGTWAGGNLTMSAGVTFNNLSGGTFDITADGRLSGGATTPINNSGLFRQTAGTASTIVTAPFNNSGNLQVLAATLSLSLGGNHTGTLTSGEGATLNLAGGSHVLTASSFVAGAGILGVTGGATTLVASGAFDNGSTLSVTAGTVTLSSGCVVTGATLNINSGVLNYNSAGSVAAITLSGGTLGGSSPINVTGPLTLGGGTVTNAFVTASGGLTINGNTTLNGGKLINPGEATWSGGAFVGANGAVVSNLFGAVFDNTFDGNANTGAGATPIFVNAGTFRKSGATAAAGTTSIDFQFINTGTMEVQTNTVRYGINQQTAGVALLDGGSLTAQAQPIQLLGGSLVGTGLVTVANIQNLINSARVSPGLPLGELDISGNYQQTAAGVLEIELGGYSAGTGFDLLTVTGGGAGGVAALGGTLNVTLTNGFAPTNGSTFTFLTAVSRVGSFATFNYPSNEIGMQVNITPTAAMIKVTNLKPVVANPIAEPAPVTYGGTFNLQFPANTFSDPDNDPLTYTASGMPPGIIFNSTTRTFSGTANQAGLFAVSVIATDGGTPTLTATNTFNITVNPATLTITADPKSKIYGAADPTLSFSVSGLQLTDTAGTVLTGTLTRAAGESVAGSPYAITQGTLAPNNNYTINFSGNSLAILPATLTIIADSKSKIYGAVDPTLTFSLSGLQFSDTEAAVLTGALTRAAGESATGSPYAITRGTLAANPNYTINFTANSLTITKAALSITADAKTKIYGATDPAFTVTYSGFVNGDTTAALGGTLGITRAPGENVGGYLITPNGLTSGNYTISFNTGTLSITKAALSVTADTKTKIYGATDPTFTVTYTGFANNDTAAALGGALSLARLPGENVGSYLITPSGLTSGNYNITFNTGTLSITKAALSVTADPKSKSYGATDPALTVTYAGFVNGDAAASLGGTLSLIRVAGENVGGYLITPSGLTSGNYTITFNTGTLTITRAALSVTADAKTKVYGATDPAFTATYSGFANGDTAAALGGTLTLARAPGENAGPYLITPSGLTSGNYNITFNTGTLTITKATLSVTADSKFKTFGTVDPGFTATYAGFVNSETPSVLTGTLSFARTTGEGVGSYTVTPSGLSSANYTIVFNTGTLTIIPPAPPILPLTSAGPNVIVLWTAVSNGTYRVQYKSDLGASNWNDLAGDVTASGSTASKTDSRTPTNRFYRILVLH